jgi:hypothetical protein
MADLCTGSSSPNSCSHFVVQGVDDGEAWSLHTSDGELSEPLTAEESATLRRLLLRKLRQKGIPLPQFIGRVVRGEEATNVKSCNLLGPGVTVTKTNIGTSWVNVLPGANGERSLVDFTGCTEYRLIASANLVGSGPFGLRVVRDSDSVALYENANIAQTGERELDTDWQTLPAEASGLALVRVQAKSVTATDDPVFRRVTMLVK